LNDHACSSSPQTLTEKAISNAAKRLEFIVEDIQKLTQQAFHKTELSASITF